MFTKKSVLKRRAFSASRIVIVAALAVLSVSLLAYATGQAAPAVIVNRPSDGTCGLGTYNLAQLNALQAKDTESCTVAPSANLTAFYAMKSSNAAVPSSFSQAALESMSWRSASNSSSSDNPSTFSVAALESMSWRSASSTSSANPLSFSVAALESLTWRSAENAQLTAQAAMPRLGQIGGPR